MTATNKLSRRLGLSFGVSIAALTTGVAAPSYAQSSDIGAEDVIVVTGSVIRSRAKDFETPSPVQTVDQKTFEQTGAIQIQDVFKGITANSGSELFGDVSTRQGTSQFSLRGLGVGSTLTLINGRRAGLAPVANATGALFSDVNQYPTNMIKNVEILTDGASATYGSEAVAGVVNIYTRDDFEGFELTAEYRDSVIKSKQLGAAFGVQGDRGSITAFANYYTQDWATREDFPNILEGSRLEDGAAGAWDSGTGSPGRFNLAVTDPVTGALSRGGRSIADPNCTAAGGILTGAGGQENCRYHFLNQRRIIPAEDRIQLYTTANYDVSDNFNVFLEAGYSKNDVTDGVGGNLIRNFPNAGGWLVPGDHPFNYFVGDGAGGITYAGPEAFAADPTLQGVDLIYRGRVLGSDADNENQSEIDTVFTNTRLVGGFDFQLNDNWNLYSSYTYANSDYSRVAPNEWVIFPTSGFSDFQSEITSGRWNPFGTRVTDPGLIGRDGVSTAGNSAEDLARFSTTRNDIAHTRLTVGEVIISGTPGLELGGGDVAMAIGAQIRDVNLSDVPDSAYQSGLNRLGDVLAPLRDESQDTVAFFGEVVAPIFENLEMQVALRYEDYGDGVDTLDPKVSAKWDITQDLALRGSWGTSFQAPSIRQLAQTFGTASVTDPRDNGNSIITTVQQGSPDLRPQSAENLNLGLVYQNDAGIKFSGDFFIYDYEDLILPGLDPQLIFNRCFAGTIDAATCSRIAVRGQDGQVARAVSEIINGGSAKVNGLDLVASYTTEMFGGNIKFEGNSTIITKFDSIDTDGVETNIKGSRNFSNGFGAVPAFRLNGGATFNSGAHTITGYGRHIGSYDDDQSGDEVGSDTTFDVRYDLELGDLIDLPGEGSRLSFGAVNVFDTVPPRLTNRPNSDFEVHDIRGRQIYVALKQTF